jgi:hypothetical protein
MERFEYELTTYDADAFDKLVVYCSEQGDCDLAEVPSEEPQKLAKVLNERGEQGWELVQLFFRKDGIVAVWKRKMDRTEVP